MNNENKYEVDVLAVGAHPDDVELAAGGSVAKLCREGMKVAIVDFTSGQLGSRGTPKIRLEEARKSADLLGIKYRENLGFRDGGLKVHERTVDKFIVMLRKYRPKALIMNPPFERHPDHEAAHNIIRNAMFKSGLIKLETEFEGEKQQPHRIRKMFCYHQSYDFPRKPDFIVDISETFEIKMEAIKCFSSQVWVPGVSDPNGPVTRLSRPEFIDELEARAKYLGTQIGVKYAEAFYSVEPLGIDSISRLL